MSELERIIQILEQMAKDQREHFARVEANSSCVPAKNKKWIDALEVQEILGISEKTVSRFNKDGTLKPRRIGRRYYYYRPAIFKDRDRFLK